MRYCPDKSHYGEHKQSPWIQDGDPDHAHGKPRMRFVDGEWRDIDYLLSEGLREVLKESK